MARRVRNPNVISGRVDYVWWENIYSCHKLQTRRNPVEWGNFLTQLFQAGLANAREAQDKRGYLHPLTDVFARRRITLSVQINPEQQEAIDHLCQTVGYSKSDMIAVLIGSGYHTVCN